MSQNYAAAPPVLSPDVAVVAPDIFGYTFVATVGRPGALYLPA